MSAGKHTSGPLHVAPCPRHEPGFSCTAVRTADGEKLVPTLADLHLHAAAPDLLEALRLAVGPDGCDGWWCPTCKEAVDGGRVSYSEHHEDCGTFLGYQSAGWVAQARAAIAKARGE